MTLRRVPRTDSSPPESSDGRARRVPGLRIHLRRFRDFCVTQLISPKKSWGEIAVEFLAAKKSPETLKAFLNTVLAELWEETHEVATDAHALWNRCEPFEAEAPDGVALITAGVDVQADRLELEIAGWGRDEESWSIAYHVIPGDVTRNEVWEHLEGLLLSENLHACGAADADRRNVHRLRVQGCRRAAFHARPRRNRRVYALDQGPRGRVADLAAQAEP